MTKEILEAVLFNFDCEEHWKSLNDFLSQLQYIVSIPQRDEIDAKKDEIFIMKEASKNCVRKAFE